MNWTRRHVLPREWRAGMDQFKQDVADYVRSECLLARLGYDRATDTVRTDRAAALVGELIERNRAQFGDPWDVERRRIQRLV